MKKIADVLHQLGLEDQLIQEIEQVGRQITVATEQLLIAPGMQAREMPLVLSGTLRVMREDAEGREIF